MKPVLLIPALCLTLAAAPLHAQEGQTAPETDSGKSLMEQGAELFWEGLRKEMAPALDDFSEMIGDIGPSMQAFLAQMGPALAEIATKVEDWSQYELPEILPNGDIIIRRKQSDTPAPETEAPTEGEGGVTDL